jgi:hypothetical protein
MKTQLATRVIEADARPMTLAEAHAAWRGIEREAASLEGAVFYVGSSQWSSEDGCAPAVSTISVIGSARV